MPAPRCACVAVSPHDLHGRTQYSERPRGLDSRTVITTERQRFVKPTTSPLLARFCFLTILCVACVTLALMSGCSPKSGSGVSAGAGSQEATGTHMAGSAISVKVTSEAFDNKPKPPVLVDPESAVRSYLDWTSYAYRIAQSKEALPVMSASEEIRVDAYLQYHLQKGQLVDSTLTSITFGKPLIKGSTATITVNEKWTYRYVSPTERGKTLRGPFTAEYNSTYTLVKNEKGDWVVDKVDAKAVGEVK
jgi:hypothetical protein